jgi:hypothetical protein
MDIVTRLRSVKAENVCRMLEVCSIQAQLYPMCGPAGGVVYLGEGPHAQNLRLRHQNLSDY